VPATTFEEDTLSENEHSGPGLRSVERAWNLVNAWCVDEYDRVSSEVFAELHEAEEKGADEVAGLIEGLVRFCALLVAQLDQDALVLLGEIHQAMVAVELGDPGHNS